MIGPDEFKGIKIFCENKYWNRQVQILLSQKIGAYWNSGVPAPWSPSYHRKYLFVQPKWDDPTRFFLSWGDKDDFDTCPLPAWTAKDLIDAGHRHTVLTDLQADILQDAIRVARQFQIQKVATLKLKLASRWLEADEKDIDAAIQYWANYRAWDKS